MPPSEAIVDYYQRAGGDYAHWSPAMHMHFGYWRRGHWPWQREPMLHALTEAVRERLELTIDQQGRVVDLGCGVGTSARQIASRHGALELLGVTLVPEQAKQGRSLARAAGLDDRVELRVADYRSLPVADASLIGAYAIESSCYDPSGGVALIREAARALRPGARLVVADAFRRRAGPLPRHAARCQRGMCEGWVLPGLAALDEFVAALREAGFTAIEIDDISLRVAPSLLHVPIAVLGFRLGRRGEALDHRRIGNLRAPLWCLATALLAPRHFGYFIVRATRG
ncbi:methyltransferase domain-containing protein [Nannocystaceae bacterium ST9]